MLNRHPTTVSECKETLKFLDYLRKSKCTQTNQFTGLLPKENYNCKVVLNAMGDVAAECLAISGTQLKK